MLLYHLSRYRKYSMSGLACIVYHTHSVVVIFALRSILIHLHPSRIN